MYKRHWDMTEIKKCNSGKGKHFFDRDTMRFFKSRIESAHPIHGPKGIFFVTSEQAPGEKRKYTIRKFNPKTCEVKTYGTFQAFKERWQAMTRAAIESGLRGSDLAVEIRFGR